MIFANDQQTGVFNFLIKACILLVAAGKEYLWRIDHRPLFGRICYSIDQFRVLCFLHKKAGADDHQRFTAADPSLAPERLHPAQRRLICIAEFGGFKNLISGDLTACPSLNNSPEDIDDQLIALLMHRFAGKKPVDKLHLRHFLFRLDPVQFTQIQIGADDHVRAVGYRQGIYLAGVRAVNDLFKLRPDHRVKRVFQIDVCLL